MGFKALKDVITKTLLSGTEKVFINDNGVTKQTAITNFMITDPEHAGNKVTSLDSFSNDKQYPSAKCVYDELQKKQDKEPFVVKVDGNSEDGYTSNYTISEIYEAYSAGQRVICQYYGIIECIPIYIEQATACFATTVLEGSVINVLIAITSDNIQVLETPLQSKLTAGHNIDIDEDGIISASFDGLDSLPTPISNAMDTDGFGWTETKDYIGIDVQWDGNTEGLENVDDVFYKIADLPDEVTSLQDIPDALVTLDVEGQTMAGTIYEFASTPYNNSDVIVLGSIFGYIILADTTYEGFQFKRGIYSTSAAHSIIITRIYHESGSEEVVHQIDQKYIPGGESAPEVKNAIETHGLGWTSEEEVEGFDIQWDGNTEGLESFVSEFFKISDKVYTEDELVGANGEYIISDVTYKGTVSLVIPEEGDDEDSDPTRCYSLDGDVPEKFNFSQSIMTVLEDTEFEGEEGVMIIHKGTYFRSPMEGYYTSRIYKESTTEEVVHQIDQKYIPSNGGSGGEGVTVVHLTATYVGDESLDITADVAAERASEILNAGGIVSVVLETHLPDGDSIWALGSAVCAAADSPLYIWVAYEADRGIVPLVSIQHGEWVLLE